MRENNYNNHDNTGDDHPCDNRAGDTDHDTASCILGCREIQRIKDYIAECI